METAPAREGPAGAPVPGEGEITFLENPPDPTLKAPPYGGLVLPFVKRRVSKKVKPSIRKAVAGLCVLHESLVIDLEMKSRRHLKFER